MFNANLIDIIDIHSVNLIYSNLHVLFDIYIYIYIFTPPAYDKKFPLLAEGLKFLNFWGRLRPSDQFLNTLSGPRIFALKRYPKDRGMG